MRKSKSIFFAVILTAVPAFVSMQAHATSGTKPPPNEPEESEGVDILDWFEDILG
ncbi:hypothetical protein [Aliiglaciecola sp. LCG003]|uniref:hypothetical protein n=1 Tax=Aliiglaciecola sp. LCG003 TaxID=3053655 RepID=UPI002573B424|nr:hypothetical protein [Aliiglaciecola sp. LCG003]WJG08070.1 hypothetical protein QR722_12010 [Aliiglaciecola sp. LCG003]